jgi:hypothetical protein
MHTVTPFTGMTRSKLMDGFFEPARALYIRLAWVLFKGGFPSSES